MLEKKFLRVRIMDLGIHVYVFMSAVIIHSQEPFLEPQKVETISLEKYIVL